MADSKLSVKGKSGSSKSEPQQIPDESQQLLELKTCALARHRILHLQGVFDEYLFIYDNYWKLCYLILSLCIVLIVLGGLIVMLKVKKQEKWLNNFETIQSILFYGGSIIIVFGNKILFVNKKAADNSKDEPKDETIQLLIGSKLGEKLDKTTKKLEGKKDSLELAIYRYFLFVAIISIIIIIFVGMELLGLSSGTDIKLDCELILCIFLLSINTWFHKHMLTNPRDKVEKCYFVTFFALISGLTDIKKLLTRTLRNDHWLVDAYLSSDEEEEIKFLLCGLDSNSCHRSSEEFCKELTLEEPTSTEETLLIAHEPLFIELVETANQEVLKNYYSLGEKLTLRLKNNSGITQRGKYVEEIVNKFPSTETEEIRRHYIELETDEKIGLTLVELFGPKKKDLNDEVIKFAHNALKVYSIFSKIGSDNIKKVKTFSASSIGEFSRDDIKSIISKNDYKPQNELNGIKISCDH